MILIFLGILVPLIVNSAEKEPVFDIRNSLELSADPILGDQVPQSWGLAFNEEQELLQNALADVYPLLDKYAPKVICENDILNCEHSQLMKMWKSGNDIRWAARNLVYYVLHPQKGGEFLTQNFSGLSAEDDPFFKFPVPGTESQFFGNKKGTIRVLLTQRFVKTIELFEYLKQKGAPQEVLAGLRSYHRSLLAHEIFHAYRYRFAPLMDFIEFPVDYQHEPKIIVPSHLQNHLPKVSYRLVQFDQEEKIEHERRAFIYYRGFVDAKSSLRAADYIDNLIQSQPHLFEKGGRFEFLSNDMSVSFTNRYLREEAQYKDHLGFTPGGNKVYFGQTKPFRIVDELVSMRKELEQNPPANQVEAMIYQPKFGRLNELWTDFATGPVADFLKESHMPCLQSVHDRQTKEESLIRNILFQ